MGIEEGFLHCVRYAHFGRNDDFHLAAGAAVFADEFIQPRGRIVDGLFVSQYGDVGASCGSSLFCGAGIAAAIGLTQISTQIGGSMRGGCII